MKSKSDSSFLEKYYKGFSCPFEPFKEELVPLIVQEFSRGISRIFIEQLDENVLSQNQGIVDSIRPWLEGQDVPGVGWDPNFGNIFQALHNMRDVNQSTLLVALAIHLASLGARGSWEADFVSPVRLRWANLLLPPTTHLSIESDGQSARIDIATPPDIKSSFQISNMEGHWHGDSLEVLPLVKAHEMRMTVLPKNSINYINGFDHLLEISISNIEKRHIRIFEESLDIISKHAPEYIPWVRRAIHNIFLLIPGDNIDSGSIEHYLGLVHFSAHPNPLAIAELLIHEASHQHMNILAKISRLEDESEQKLYYSPPVDSYRKIHFIIAAYHAFANVLIFYRLCKDTGIDDRRECDRIENMIFPWLRKLEEPLVDNPSITPIGEALWKPLYKILH